MTRACLKDEGNVFSAKHRLRRVVIGGRRASMQSFRRNVGKMSRGQVELLQERISLRTSVGEVGEKEFRGGGGEAGRIWGEELVVVMDAHS